MRYSWLEPFTNARRVFRPESANLHPSYQPLSDFEIAARTGK